VLGDLLQAGVAAELFRVTAARPTADHSRRIRP
jgi:hypothetical protein